MPYTPPSHNSPAASRPESPTLSRSHSYLKGQSPQGQSHQGHPPPPPTPAHFSRPGLPRSTSSSSYLHKHRRSPSFSQITPADEAASKHNGSPAVHSGDLAATTDERANLDSHGSLRQSPPPVNNALIPTGAMISPPESLQNSSDEDEESRGRGRDLENLAELQAAISILEQRKEGSPNRQGEEAKKAKAALDVVVAQSKAANANNGTKGSTEHLRLPLSKEARKISHSRSSTDLGFILDLSHQVESPIRTSTEDSSEAEEDSEGNDRPRKPPMVRKKSGELVRPALRPASSKRRPSSMPGTPTYSKAVHFDSHLEHVRHFLQVDKPLAVSAGSSPVEAYESEIEFPFGYDDNARPRAHPYEWEIRLTNFPSTTEARKDTPVHVERVFLSADNKNLIGSVAVQNLAFHKQVTARFTLDYWKTTSEVVADFNNDVRRKQANDGLDHFNFSIKLADLAHLENKTMFFCVRYNVNGQEYWDNNNSVNYQVDFTKKAKPQMGKHGMQGAASRPLNGLPRSRPSPPGAAGSRPKSMPVSFDDFSAGLDNFATFDTSPSTIIGESPIKLKGPRTRHEIVPDAPARRSNPASQAFGTRYDFAASLSAAIATASVAMGDKSGLPVRDQKPESQHSHHEVAAPPTKPASLGQKQKQITAPKPTGQTSQPPKAQGPASGPSKPAALVSEKPSLSSTSYQELVDKYCFFGSSKSSPQPSKSTPGQLDGANDDASVSDVNVGSAKSSGHATPATPPATPKREHPITNRSPRASRSASPASVRASSPVSFGYPYHQPMQNGFYPESHAPTAIHG